MKATATSLLCLATAIVFADGITISTAQPSGKLLAELSKMTGKKLMAAANVRDDVVLLSCKDASTEEVMAKIAKVLHAQWITSRDEMILSRDSNFVNADQKAELATKTAALRKKVTEMFAGVQAQGEFTPASAKKMVDDGEKLTEAMTNGGRPNPAQLQSFQANAQKSPGSRAVTKVLASLSDRELGWLASGRRVVFSNHPTNMQLPLSNASLTVANNFVREQQMIASATPPQNNDNERRITIGGFGDSSMGNGDPNDATTVMLVMNDNGPIMRGGSMARLTVADSKGETICSGSSGIMPTPAAPTGVSPKADEKVIALSDMAKQFDAAMAAVTRGDSGMRRVMAFATSNGPGSAAPAPVVVSMGQPKTPLVTLSPELRKALLNPEDNEPLGFSALEAMKAIADRDSQSLCAYLPDSVTVPIARTLAQRDHKPGEFRSFASRQYDLDFSADGAWLLVQPRAAYSARNSRVNRSAFGKLLRTLEKQKSLTLTDCSVYATTRPQAPTTNDLDLAVARAINNSATDQTLAPAAEGPWQMVRVYGLLAPNQRQDLLAGQALSVRNLAPDVVSCLTEQVFQSPDGPNALGSGGGPIGARFIFGGQRVSDERTFLLPSGVPNASMLKMSAHPQAVIQTKDADGSVRIMSADQLAFEKFQAENPGALPGGGEAPNVPTAFRTTAQTTFDIQLVLGPNYGIDRSLQDTAAGDGPFVSYDQLPNEVRAQVEERLAMLKQGTVNGRGGRVPPPVR